MGFFSSMFGRIGRHRQKFGYRRAGMMSRNWSSWHPYSRRKYFTKKGYTPPKFYW